MNKRIRKKKLKQARSLLSEHEQQIEDNLRAQCRALGLDEDQWYTYTLDLSKVMHHLRAEFHLRALIRHLRRSL